MRPFESFRNLRDDPTGQVVYPVLDEFADTPTGRYWRPRLGHLGAQCGSYEELAKHLLIVEFHAYHAENWHGIGVTLPSQWFGFDLVCAAVKRDATIVPVRGWEEWAVAVPSLLSHPAVYRPRSP